MFQARIPFWCWLCLLGTVAILPATLPASAWSQEKEDEEESIDAVIENLVVDLSVVEDISARAKQPIAAVSVEHDPSEVPDFDNE